MDTVDARVNIGVICLHEIAEVAANLAPFIVLDRLQQSNRGGAFQTF